MVVALPLEEYCPSCGEWVSYLHFDHTVGWCNQCSRTTDDAPRCIHCGTVLPANHGRTSCHTCRQERWLARHIDEVEFLIVVKGYSLYQARHTIMKLVRPICQSCRKPIKGGHETALFHKGAQYKGCHAAYARYTRLVKKGLTHRQALDTIRRPR